jgi:hypothetical protein
VVELLGCWGISASSGRISRPAVKYGYPPDLQDAAVQTVLLQAEALSAEWASAA